MKLKVTLHLILAILLMMLGAGGASAYIGYLMGREALKVVTQPDTDSEQTINRKKPIGGSHKGLNVVEERTVLINVYNHIHRKENPSSDQKQSSIEGDAVKKSARSDNQIKPDYFPVRDRSGDVTMEISRTRIEGNSVILDVNLKNESSKPVRFLYSFLDVRDEDNRPLSAIADGLPGELPPNGQNFSGTFIIPVTLIDNSQTISLTLQDYPEQKLTLQLKSIPLAK